MPTDIQCVGLALDEASVKPGTASPACQRNATSSSASNPPERTRTAPTRGSGDVENPRLWIMPAARVANYPEQTSASASPTGDSTPGPSVLVPRGGVAQSAATSRARRHTHLRQPSHLRHARTKCELSRFRVCYSTGFPDAIFAGPVCKPVLETFTKSECPHPSQCSLKTSVKPYRALFLKDSL